MLETILGDTIVHDGVGTNAYYTPPFGRGGEAAVFTVEVTHRRGSTTLVVKVEHKNPEESAWTVAGTFSNITATGVFTKEIQGLKEELRFSFVFSAGSQGNYVHFLLPAPMWLPY